MKLELKHLVGYLPYDLKGIMYYGGCVRENVELGLIDIPVWLNGSYPIKLILHPLSDILEEEFQLIWANETDFESIKQCVELGYEGFLNCRFSFEFWQDLFKNHIDIQGLIENGLAIDINTLK